MNLFDLKEPIAYLAVATTILQFLSGILVCKQYVANKTTAEASSFPFIAGVLSCGIWLLYGLTKRNDKIVTVNTIGLVLMISYSVIFYFYTFKKSAVLRQCTFTIIFFLILLGYISVEEDNENLVIRLGTLASSFTIVTVAAPLSKLLHVIRVKSTECLPFPMILMSLFVSAFWYLYGYIDQDLFVAVPNFIGMVLAMVQLVLFLIFPSTSHSSKQCKSTIA
ncbi:PREDICTED: sugar transporter SWEET1-like isoform X2 [Papilio polytes]|uniref:sugar transporter SWEET1-like isoform X2 n=1 Tax=Papilio polytes TaxID=76194 RepID=UPI00067605A1|nr:PREDICTED: sugar transporter SWEET1-like isoform X2 [Papilio polytes]